MPKILSGKKPLEITVQDVPLGATIEEIHELFTKFGEIQNLKLKKNKV